MRQQQLPQDPARLKCIMLKITGLCLLLTLFTSVYVWQSPPRKQNHIGATQILRWEII